MSVLRGSIFVIFSCAIVLALGGPAPGPDDHDHMEKMCAGQELKFPMPDDGMKKDMDACKTDPQCPTLCVARVLGVIDDKGMVIESEVMDKIQAVAPASKLAEINKAVTMCLEKHGKMLDMQKCATYTELIKCAGSGIKPICGWKD